MAERRQPDYDFFGPGQGPPPTGQPPAGPPAYGAHPPYGAPPPPQPPYGGPPYGTPSHSFGVPPAPPHGAGWQVGPAPYPVPPRSRAVTALIAAAVVLVSIIGIGIVSAVAIPVFLSQRMKAEWRSTTIALPATFDGGERMSVPTSDATSGVWDGVGGELQAATYITDESVGIIVFAAKAPDPLTTEDQAATRREFLTGEAETGTGLSLTESDPGKLGGWFGCGAAPDGDRRTVCLATDHAGVLAVLVAGSQDPVGDARRMREAVVRR